MRLVLDTNVLVSALIAKEKPSKFVEKVLEKRTELVMSKPILDEFVKVVARPKFLEYVDETEVKDFLQLVLGVSAFVDVRSKFNVTSDKSDNSILATAYDGKADYIVSGDRHLLQLKRFKGIRIITVAQALNVLKK
jgi:putative PIN family toxin of toxin-antitoxin system